MLAFRRAGALATVAAAGAMSALATTAMRLAQQQRHKGGGGVVAGQDTPLQVPQHHGAWRGGAGAHRARCLAPSCLSQLHCTTHATH